jgi:FtsZ-binding cell division protein ZapB
MQHLQSLNLLEERIQRAVELITYLKSEKKKLEAETAQLVEAQRQLERRVDGLVGEKQDLAEESRLLRAKQEEWVRFERDREEIRTRIDGMLAKFEELEI